MSNRGGSGLRRKAGDREIGSKERRQTVLQTQDLLVSRLQREPAIRDLDGRQRAADLQPAKIQLELDAVLKQGESERSARAAEPDVDLTLIDGDFDSRMGDLDLCGEARHELESVAFENEAIEGKCEDRDARQLETRPLENATHGIAERTLPADLGGLLEKRAEKLVDRIRSQRAVPCVQSNGSKSREMGS